MRTRGGTGQAGRLATACALAIALLLARAPAARAAPAELDSTVAAPDSSASPDSLPPSSAPDSGGAAVAAPASPPRPGLGGRAGRAAGNFLSDGWAVVRSPFRASPAQLIGLAAALGVEAVLYANDQAILDASIRNRDAPVYRTALDLGDRIEPVGFMGRTNPIYVGLLGLGYALGVRPLRTIPTEILESHLIAGGVRNVGKALVGRHHPYEDDGPRAFTFGHGTSFPSGHTSVVFELATIGTLNTPARARIPVAVAAYGLATTVALQRVESRNHWPSDVFVAACYGTFVARTVVRLHEQRERARRSAILVVPEVGDGGRLVGLRFSRAF